MAIQLRQQDATTHQQHQQADSLVVLVLLYEVVLWLGFRLIYDSFTHVETYTEKISKPGYI